ncbi:MAG: hypothetical protein NXY57DRAFT_1092397, partial [Lentinula lateritia]
MPGSARLNNNANTFVPRPTSMIVIKSADGSEVNLENLKKGPSHHLHRSSPLYPYPEVKPPRMKVYDVYLILPYWRNAALQLANEQQNRTHRLRSSLKMTHGTKGKEFKKLPSLTEMDLEKVNEG